jgi:TetR/AcrR family transcriptional repressor of multidrug resistance operon
MRKRDEVKTKLVKEQAIKMLVEKGFDGFSMQKLAKACNISVATLYIYYKHKEDLISKIGIEESTKMFNVSLKNFSSDLSFADGLKLQWENRAKFYLKNPLSAKLMDMLWNSPYGQNILASSGDQELRPLLEKFLKNAVKNKQLIPIKSFPVYWSLAYGPLYALIHFHQEKKSAGGNSFKFSNQLMYQTLEIVLKGLTP